MKSAAIFLFLMLFSACAMNTVESRKLAENPPSEVSEPVSKTPVLVELFTSEGCSSCPPADRALAFLDKEQPIMQAEIITLALHVDYWNYLGWKDEFSSPLFSRRQEFYAQKFKLNSSYTPQMVVDGNWEFTGSDLGRATSAIMEAAKSPKAKLIVSRDGDRLNVNISGLPGHRGATVYLAVAENNLSSNVARGENKGQKLEHAAVVRELKAVGLVEAGAESLESQIVLPNNPVWKRENLKAVLFVQDNTSRKILGIIKVLLE
jgi:hypothetical protein